MLQLRAHLWSLVADLEEAKLGAFCALCVMQLCDFALLTLLLLYVALTGDGGDARGRAEQRQKVRGVAGEQGQQQGGGQAGPRGGGAALCEEHCDRAGGE